MSHVEKGAALQYRTPEALVAFADLESMPRSQRNEPAVRTEARRSSVDKQSLRNAIENPNYVPRTRLYKVTLERVWWWPPLKDKPEYTFTEEQYQNFRYNRMAQDLNLDAFFTSILSGFVLWDAQLIFGAAIAGFSPLVAMPFIIAYCAGKALSAAGYSAAGKSKFDRFLGIAGSIALGGMSLLSAAYFLGPIVITPWAFVVAPLMLAAYFAGEKSIGVSPWYRLFCGRYYKTNED